MSMIVLGGRVFPEVSRYLLPRRLKAPAAGACRSQWVSSHSGGGPKAIQSWTRKGERCPGGAEGRNGSNRPGWFQQGQRVASLSPCLSQGWFLSCLACAPFFLAGLRRGKPSTPRALPSRCIGSFSSPRLQKVAGLSLGARVSWAGLESEQCAPTSYPLQHPPHPCPPSSLWIREQGVPRPQAYATERALGDFRCLPWIAGNSSKVIMLVVVRVNVCC